VVELKLLVAPAVARADGQQPVQRVAQHGARAAGRRPHAHHDAYVAAQHLQLLMQAAPHRALLHELVLRLGQLPPRRLQLGSSAVRARLQVGQPLVRQAVLTRSRATAPG
jgi:hypothetical protein